MIATNVEELVNLLETFDADQPLSSGVYRGKMCICIGDYRIMLPSSFPFEV